MTLLFETDRLSVRQFVDADLDAFAALCANPQAMQFMGDGATLSREEVAHWIQICYQKYEQRGYGTSAVIEKATGNFVGFCGVVRAPDRDFDEIIYAFVPEVWGKGYATEAAQAMLNYIFEQSTLDKIYATIHPDNAASHKIMPKLGMQFEREETDDEGVAVFYGITRPTQNS